MAVGDAISVLQEAIGSEAWSTWDQGAITSGVYLLLFEGQVVYAGKARDVRARLIQHERDRDKGFKEWDSAKFMLAPESQIMTLEAALIAQYQPPMNRVGIVDDPESGLKEYMARGVES